MYLSYNLNFTVNFSHDDGISLGPWTSCLWMRGLIQAAISRLKGEKEREN